MYKIFKQLTAKPGLANSLFYTLTNNILVVVLNLLGFLILVRYYTESEMGIWTIFLSITTIFEASRSALIKPALIRLINSEDKSNNSRIQGGSIVISLAMVFCVIIILAAIAFVNSRYWHTANLSSMLSIYMATTLVFTVFYHIEFVLQAATNFRKVFQMYFFKQAVFLVMIVILINIYDGPYKLIYAAGIQLFSVVMASLVAIGLGKSFINIKIKGWYWVKKLWGFGRFILFSNMNALVFRNTDHLMIAAMLSPASVAYYNLAVRITNFLDLPTNAVSEALFPKSVLLSKEGSVEDSRQMYEVSVGAIIAVLIPSIIFIYLFATPAVILIAGENYIEAVPLLQITLMYALLLPFHKQFGMIIDSIGEPRINTQITTVLLICNVVFNYLLIYTVGLTGAAYGTLITYVLGATLSVYFLNKQLNVTFFGVLRQVPNSYVIFYNKIKDIF